MKTQIQSNKKLDIDLVSLQVRKRPASEVRISFTAADGKTTLQSFLTVKPGIDLPFLNSLSGLFESDASVMTGEKPVVVIHDKGSKPMTGDAAKTFLSSRVNTDAVVEEALSAIRSFLSD